MVPEPLEIGVGTGLETAADSTAQGRAGSARRSADLPAVRFGMAISEREVRRAVMKRTREIAPLEFVEAVHEKTVVDCIRMFIEKNKTLAGINQVAALEELAPVRIELVGEFTGITHEMVHRHGAKACAVIRERDIAGTFVDSDALVDVFAEKRLGEEKFVRVVRLCSPGLDAVDPIVVLAFGLADPVIVDVAVIVVVCVKLPTQGKLFDVVQAGDALALFLRFAECRQEKPGEDRNDRDDDQEFDEGKGLCVVSGEQRATSAAARSSFQCDSIIQAQ